MLIKTPFNRELHPCNYEQNNEPSETVPDQTMSIRTILDRYSRGLPIGGQLNGTYQEDDEYNDLPDPRTLDLSERQEIAINAKQELEDIKKVLNKKKAKQPEKLAIQDDLTQPTTKEAVESTN